ncbi:RNase P modulator RnpM [Chloroflexota bacterium]
MPQRTCVACRKIRSKKDLVRLVRTSDNRVEIDESGKQPGRGVYLCPTQECWEVGIMDGRLEYSLKIKLTQFNRVKLIKFGDRLLKE